MERKLSEECHDCGCVIPAWSGLCAPCARGRDEQGRNFERTYDEARASEMSAMDAGVDPADTERFELWLRLK